MLVNVKMIMGSRRECDSNTELEGEEKAHGGI
jgi:hypothetical protein